MTQLAHEKHYCYECRSKAIATCDFRRTAYDRCNRPACAAHSVDVVTGHLCADHHETIDKLTSSDKNRNETGVAMKSFAGVIGILVAAAIIFSLVSGSVQTVRTQSQSITAALLR